MTVADVQERTGFPVILPDHPVRTTPVPTQTELSILRTEIDRTRVLA